MSGAVTGGSKADRAYAAILEGIRGQRHAPGDRLVLAQIAAELEMSVVPVREAIRRLQSESLVRYERNIGATVVGIDPVEYRLTMETLALVEGYSTAQCAPHVTAQDLTRARTVNDRMRALVDGRRAWDPQAFTELNHEFHTVLFEHHQNEHILDLVHRGWNRLAALRSSTFSFVPGRASASVQEHEELLGLIEDAAPFARIEAAARAHRLNTLHAYLDHQADRAEPGDRAEPADRADVVAPAHPTPPTPPRPAEESTR
ncbi:GntR family transcriptional regulator [Micrococcus sp.]|uniref:GntR family transcriptional regulator n=1 Tax=Micrococcus sp. TaxID=1271 RepID=UPI002A90CF83|nr:GntR family transcriptional regulator [Micrococcus sp.]MDY6055068.1 GntR family transcriptional regulator [Micrococcus sp.]